MENLDAMAPDDLMKFWSKHARGHHYALLFPGKPLGCLRATADLANYASNKATAIECRKRGDVQTALEYEGICERIYKHLPAFARW